MSRSAAEVLRANDRGTFTVPSGTLYPFQWLWDAAFLALGWSTIDRSRAWDELDTVVRGQWHDGMLPHVVYHHPSERYFPAPDLWGVGHQPPTSGITQPPVLTSVVLRLVTDAGGDDESLGRARRLWPVLMAFHAWFHRCRDLDGDGLVCSYHPWETGMDNSPAWDEPMTKVPLDDLVAYRRTDTDHVEGDQRPTSKDYDRYAAIIGELRKAGYDAEKLWRQCSFRVADAATNAILVRADADLVTLGRLLDEDTAAAETRAARSAHGLQKLWSSEHGHFLSMDLWTGHHLLPATSASFLGLWAGTVTEDQRVALAAHLDRWRDAAGSLVPSTDPATAQYEPGRYWRGPVWVNVNWMVAEGLRAAGDEDRSEQIADDTRRLVTGAGMWEYFQPKTGEGLGAADFGWTAALARYWLGID